MLRLLLIITLSVSLSACAKPPLQQLDAAEYMLKRAQILDAGEFAPTEYQAAHTALVDARLSIDKTDYRDARDSLEFSLQHSRRAIKIAQESKARRAEEEAARIEEAEKARMAELIVAEEKRENQALTAKIVVKKTPPKPKATIEPAATYAVGEGETLWTISAQPEVYNEGLLWPLLYQANRDQIKDPRQIFPGQTLSIRRDMTQNELEEARQKAKESDIFPLSEASETLQ